MQQLSGKRIDRSYRRNLEPTVATLLDDLTTDNQNVFSSLILFIRANI